MMQLRAVFFDFLNTLAEFQDLSFKDTSRNLHQLLVDAGFQVSYSQFHQYYTEVIQGYITIRKEMHKEVSNLDFIVETLKCLGMEAEKSDPKLQSIVNAYFIPFRESLRIFPKTRDTLTTLKEDFCLKLGVISNFTSTKAIHDFLMHLDLKQFFDVIVVSSEVGMRKPHHHIFEIGLQKMGVDSKEAAFVGDDIVYDIAGANDMGMVTIQVGAPVPPPIDQLAEVGQTTKEPCLPDYKVDSIFEIINIISNLCQPSK
ncbi:MAG: HAD family hydrolase [Candidatus Heimdallarchaeota archaeon]